MNKKLLFIGAAIIVVIAGGLTYLLMREPNPGANVPPQVVEKTEPSVADSQELMPGSYRLYSPELVAGTKGTKILFFYAAWCPQCRELDSQIAAGPLPNNVTIFKVDYDENQALRQKYGVQLQTTLVTIDDDGNLVQKLVAYERPSLAYIIEKML